IGEREWSLVAVLARRPVPSALFPYTTLFRSYLRWRYHYPQHAYPYDELDEVNGARGRHDTEYELVDTGNFLVDTGIFDDDRYWAVEVEYAKATPTDLCMLITDANRGPDPATLHVMPTLW